MEPSTSTSATVEAPAPKTGTSEETPLEEPGKPAEAPGGSRTPPPTVPPVAIATGDGGDDEDGDGDGEGDEDKTKRSSAGAAGSSDSGETPQTGAISRRIYLGVPAEGVWPWLVDPELVRGYHLADLAARPEKVGDPMQFKHRLAGHLLIAGEVLEWQEGRRLSYSYTFLREEPEPPSRVTMELIRYGDQMCRLELRHEDLLMGGETWRDANVFWDVALSSLKTWLETGHPLPWPGRGR